MRPIIVSFVLAGCASAPVVKIPFEEAFGARSTPRAAAAAAAERAERRPNPELHAALFAFADQAEAARVGAQKGGKMSPASSAAWQRVLGAVDVFLVAPAATASPFDLARTRLVLQTELATDAQLYGDFPALLAERAQVTLHRLTSRLAQLVPPQKKADPRKFLWPVTPVLVTSPYGGRVHPFSGNFRFHGGTDILAELAQPVRASADGRVIYAGWNGAYGKQVELQHDRHLATRYGHLEAVLVRDGARVRRGDIIGLAGATGQATGVHLHFELLRDGEREDPEELLPAPPTKGLPNLALK